MFHVLLVAPLLGLLAAYGIVVLIVLSVPFCLGGFFQLVLTIAAGDRWAVWGPAGLGGLGLALSFDRRGLFRQCRTCFWRRKKVRGAYVSAPGPVGGSATSGDFGHL